MFLPHCVSNAQKEKELPHTQKELTLPVVERARANDEFRNVLWTGEQTQLVLMAIPRGRRGARRA